MATAETQPQTDAQEGRLAHFPISFFAVVMGLSGLTLATLRFEHTMNMTHAVSIGMFIAVVGCALVIATIYFIKILHYPQAVRAEWNHPVRLAFFPAVSISIILLGTAAFPFHKGLSLVLWGSGSAFHLVATLAVVSQWIGHRPFEIPHLNPAWFIPAVGNILVPIAGVKLGYSEVSWFFFSVGVVFWVVLMTLVFNRLVFHNPLPERLLPTLVILIAPPAVGFISYVALVGAIDPFARILFYAAVIFALILLTQLAKFSRLNFALSWWAYSFPIAALTVATFLYAEKTHSDIHLWAAYGVFITIAAIIVLLIVNTLRAIFAGKICQPE